MSSRTTRSDLNDAPERDQNSQTHDEKFYEAMPASAIGGRQYMEQPIEERPVREVVVREKRGAGFLSKLGYLLLGIIIGMIAGLALAGSFGLTFTTKSQNVSVPSIQTK